MRKNITPILLLAILPLLVLSGCVSSKKYLKQGNYEAAFQVALAKLEKNPNKDKQIYVLEEAYNTMLEQDLVRIDELKASGSPDCWIEIYDLYTRIKYRQDMVEPLLPLYLGNEYSYANLPLLDVDDEILNAKEKAADYLYTLGTQKLASDNKATIREAYYDFQQVKEYFTNFRDVDAKMAEALEKGKNHVQVMYVNNSGMVVPDQFQAEIMNFNLGTLNTLWVDFIKTNGNSTQTFEYDIVVHISNVNIGAEKVTHRDYKDEKIVEDGWEYQLDSEGNVVKDSLGNDIKVPRKIKVVATIHETTQYKGGLVAGSVDFFKGQGNQLLSSKPFSENMVFENYYATYTGDSRALSNTSKKKLGGGPLPFPNNYQMMLDGAVFARKSVEAHIKNGIGIVMQ